MSPLEILAVLLTLSATFAWINFRFLRLPTNVGLLAMGLGASLLMVAGGILFPEMRIYGALATMLRQIDFYQAVMHGMLAFLLFAGALHVDIARLRSRGPVVATLATAGVVISMLLVATGTWLAAHALGLPLPFAWAVVFGALIAPTDPVAVLSTLKSVNVPPSLETDITGEALFNDGIAIVLFTLALEFAGGQQSPGIIDMARLLVIEAGGGALLGFATGYAAYRAMRAVDDYSIEVMISLALVTATYAIAGALHMSGPIAVVVAGVLIGNRGAADAMSETTKRYVFGFWTLVDDILNSVLFLLIGLEVVVLRFDPEFGWMALVAVPLAVLARFLAVSGPLALLTRWHRFPRGTATILTWAGVRGGISVALALSLPESPARTLILTATYAVVLFTIIVQGLSLAWAIRRSPVGDAPSAPRG
ncbi:MAG: cation:proton antiporter [Alphaproteobacteria bacterium]